MANFIIRTDASEKIGTGHVMRCLTLAQALRDQGASIHFICRPLPGDAIDRISAEGFPVSILELAVGTKEDEDARATIAQVRQIYQREGDIDWIIVDHYELGREWEHCLRPEVKHIMVIDDCPEREHDCDLLLDQNYQPKERLPEKGKSFQLLGPRYALLREQFMRASVNAVHPVPERVRRVLVSFGGSDPTSETEKTLHALDSLQREGIVIDVVVGAANPRRDRIEALVAGMSDTVFYHDAKNMAELMGKADLAIGGGGTTTWERCALALPSVVIAQAENQVLPAKRLAEAGVHIYLGRAEHVEEHDIAEAICFLIDNHTLRQYLARQGRQLVDGQGVQRVIKRLCQPEIRLREAKASDRDAILTWRNNAEVRRYSGSGALITAEQHQQWFAQVLSDSCRLLLIGEVDDEPVGVLRYDIEEDVAEVSIYLCPGKMGQGYGVPLLIAGRQWLQQKEPEIKTIRAKVDAENKASLAAFNHAGYRVSKLILEDQLENV